MLTSLIILIFTSTNSVVRGLTRYDPYTCYDTKEREFYCCSNYEEINDKCIECKIGFKSRNGKACKPCSLNLYGKGCSQECNCNDLQGCDNVQGCVDKETIRTSKPGSSKENVTIAQTDNYDTGISKTELLMLYSGASSGIIVILGILGVLYCFKQRKCIYKEKDAETTEQKLQNTAIDDKQETFEPHERLYEEIDESEMENTQNIWTPNLPKQNSSNSKITVNCNIHEQNRPFQEENDKSMKAVPFATIFHKSDVDKDSYLLSKATEDDSSSAEITVDYNNDRTSYLHPYNTLAAKLSYCHTYDIPSNAVRPFKI